MAKRRKGELNVFSMSFLDAITAGFGCVVLLFMLVSANAVLDSRTVVENREAEARRATGVHGAPVASPARSHGTEMQSVEGSDGDASVDAPCAGALRRQAGERGREPSAVEDGLPRVDVPDAWEWRRCERQAARLGLVPVPHPREVARFRGGGRRRAHPVHADAGSGEELGRGVGVVGTSARGRRP